MNTVVISTVGTSLLTQNADQYQHSILNEKSNFTIDEVDSDYKSLVESISEKASNNLMNADLPEVRKKSAELNGLLRFYKNDFSKAKGDLHFLFTTDTFVGQKTAKVVKDYLSHHNINAQIISPKNLSTKNEEHFSEGIKWILKWCSETLDSYKENKYKVVFNLTGGFKSIQGIMNSIGMFYADKIVYIFESTESELIEIPRLPIKIDDEFFVDHAVELTSLSQGKIYNVTDFIGYPEVIFDSVEGNAMLSLWGELLWNKVKPSILSSELLQFPLLVYEDSFKKDFDKITMAAEKVKLQEVLAKVSILLESGRGDTSLLKKDGGLLYENFTNKYVQELPIGHFRINQSDRISCLHRNGKLYLRKCGRHDYVNNNP